MLDVEFPIQAERILHESVERSGIDERFHIPKDRVEHLEVKNPEPRVNEDEQNEKVRKIRAKDLDYLNSNKTETATARQFLFIARCKSSKSENVLQKANRVEKIISDQGFEVTRMKKADIKRFLAIYFDASMNGDLMPDYDGEQYISEVENEEA